MFAEDGLINLLDPVSYYLPGCARKGKQPITIHQVLSHQGWNSWFADQRGHWIRSLILTRYGTYYVTLLLLLSTADTGLSRVDLYWV